jgi:fatty acid desaturase
VTDLTTTRSTPSPIAARLRREYAAEVYAHIHDVGSDAEAARDLLLHIALAVGAAAGCAWLTGLTPFGWLAYPLVVFFIGTRFRAMGNMLHEASHGVLVKGKRRNAVWGRVLAVLDFTRLEPYTEEHFSHHRHLGHPTKDLDFVSRQKFGFGQPEPRFVLRHYLRPLTLFHVPTFLRPVFFHREDPWAVRLGRLLYVGVLVGLGAWLGPWPVLLYFVLPYVTAYQVIRYWSDAVDHAGAMQREDEFHRSRNHIFRVELLNRILFPRYDEFHLTHHIFPAVPVRHQPKVHALLMRDPEYAARCHDILGLHHEAALPLAAPAEARAHAA